MTDKLDIEAERRQLDKGHIPIGEAGIKNIGRKALNALETERTKTSDLSVALAASGKINKELHESIEVLEGELNITTNISHSQGPCPGGCRRQTRKASWCSSCWAKRQANRIAKLEGLCRELMEHADGEHDRRCYDRNDDRKINCVCGSDALIAKVKTALESE